jgi:putative phosphoesterase
VFASGGSVARVRVAVVADTHLRRGRRRALPASAVAVLQGADVILHAGDIVEPWVLDELAELAPVHAVLGNNDHGVDLPERLELELGGVRVAMVHDSGPRAGRSRRLRRWFPTARLVVFGHSHIPLHEDDGEQALLNPGSPTDRRRQPHHTLATVEVRDGTLGPVALHRLD